MPSTQSTRSIEAALIEQLARNDLSAAGQARACAGLSELGLTQRQIGERTRRNPNTMSNLIRLAKLSEEILELIDRGDLTGSHGKALLVARDLEVRGELARRAAQQGWPVLTLQARARLSNEDAGAALSENPPTPQPLDRRPVGPETDQPLPVVERARMIAWVDAVGAVTPNALAVHDQLSIPTAEGRLDEAVRLGLLDKHAVLVGYPALYTTTKEGRVAVRSFADRGGYTYASGLNVPRINIKDARHMIACASVVAGLERRYPDHRLVGERQLRREESQAGRRIASVPVRQPTGPHSHFPDMAIWPPHAPGEPPPLPVAVEVELALKSRERLSGICDALANGRHLEGTVYYVETKRVEERLLEMIERLKVEDRIAVNPLSVIVSSLPGFELVPWEEDQ
jgi:ParB-like chromosome segregation protein Spo0J